MKISFLTIIKFNMATNNFISKKTDIVVWIEKDSVLSDIVKNKTPGFFHNVYIYGIYLIHSIFLYQEKFFTNQEMPAYLLYTEPF